MIRADRWRHVQRITAYTLLMFGAFVISWVVLMAKARAEIGEVHRTLVTDVEIHSLQARWGVDLLTVPLIAVVIALVRRRRSALLDVVVALMLGLTIAPGMAYFPSAVMGGHIRWPLVTTWLDTTGYIDLSLTYAIATAAVLFIVNRIAARRSSFATV